MKTDELSLELGILSALCDTIASPFSIWVKALMEAKLWIKLLKVDIKPEDYSSANDFADDYLLANILSKSAHIPYEADLEAEAVQSFMDCERRCEETNCRLYSAKVLPSWVYDVQDRVRTILGPLTSSALDKVVRLARFGSGAAVGYAADGLVTSIKYDDSQTLTPNLIPFVRPLMGEPFWEHHNKSFTVVPGNKFFTVPKNATKRRSCAKEPSLNGFLQLGIGRYMESRLRIFGVNLSDQGRNQALARKAYEMKLATLDMSSASDLLSKAVPHLLLTFEWNHLLDVARSPSMTIGNRTFELAKHSSMGNGYTFPLETIVFKAVVDSVVCDKAERATSVAVYGDDIICPQWAADEVVTRLEYLGFQVNRRKSHLAGDFFESCGEHYFRGSAVRPFYARRSVEGNDIPYAVQLANALRRYAGMRGALGYCDPRFRPIWDMLMKHVPAGWKSCLVPDHMGDVGVLSSRSEAEKFGIKKAFGWKGTQLEGFRVKYMLRKVKRLDRRTYGVLLASMSSPSVDHPSKGREVPRGAVGMRRARVLTTEWPAGLEWLDAVQA